MAGIDPGGADTRGIIDRRVLIGPGLVAFLVLERQQLDVNLDVMTGDLLGVALHMHGSTPGPGWQAIQPVATEDPGNGRIADPEARVSLKIPDDADRPKMIFLAQIEDFSTTSGGAWRGCLRAMGFWRTRPVSPRSRKAVLHR
jgi:hypothetical protein